MSQREKKRSVFSLSRLREREGRGKVRVFFLLLLEFHPLGRRKKTLTQTLSRARERA